jgi:hypothetical protein
MRTPPKESPPALLRTRHLASNYFGVEGTSPAFMSSIPRSKYMFYARFVTDRDAGSIFPWLEQYKTGSPDSNGVSFKIKQIDKPKLELNTVELNQYNRKRYAYTKVEYQPFTIKLHDTVDNAPLQLWKDYFMYYFGDSRGNKPSLMNDSTVNAEFRDGTGWGFRPISEDLSFFTSVELYSIYGRRYTQLNYLNPKITNVDWTQYDSSSSEPDEVSLTLRYEAIEYVNEKEIDDAMLNTFGFDVDVKAIEPAAIMTPTTNPRRPRPRSTSESFRDFTANNAEPIVINTNRSIVTDFGLNSGAYEQFMAPEMRTQSTTTFTAALSPAGISASFSTNSYSNNPNVTQNILGVPTGALPRVTGQIFGSTTMGSLPANSSSLSVYGTFNFGSF